MQKGPSEQDFKAISGLLHIPESYSCKRPAHCIFYDAPLSYFHLFMEQSKCMEAGLYLKDGPLLHFIKHLRFFSTRPVKDEV